jgi:hypothetical protein
MLIRREPSLVDSRVLYQLSHWSVLLVLVGAVLHELAVLARGQVLAAAAKNVPP